MQRPSHIQQRWILRRRIERKIEDALGEDQFGFRKGARDAIVMLRIISECTLDIDEEMCACFIDWQKAFNGVNWTKLMQTLKGPVLYMEQSVKSTTGPRGDEKCEDWKRVRQGCCLSQTVQIIQ
jgi:hypothetical protein